MDLISILIAVAGIVNAAPSAQPPVAHKPVAPASQSGSTVKLRDSRYGRILVTGRGLTLYLFTKETTPKPRCYGACAKAWPPFYTKGKPKAGAGLDPRKVGSSKRRGGRRQVTYDGHPLYRYFTEKKPGDIFCQNVPEFGGTWLVVGRTGDAVR
jgi:predicted lipoprotein with Yx(FWY)xxD motif